MVSQILKLKDVKQQTALSSSSIYLKVSQGIFPKPIKLGIRSSGWVQSEVQRWIKERIRLSRDGGIS